MRAHAISCSSFQFSRTVKMVGSDRKYGCSDIVDTFSPTFRNPIFLFSPIVKYENLDYKKIRNFQTSFRYSPTVKYKNLKFKIRDFNTNICLVDICL